MTKLYSLNQQQKQVLISLLIYLGISLVVLISYIYQISLPEQVSPFFLVIYLLIFFSVSEIVGAQAGLYTSLLIITFQLLAKTPSFYIIIAFQAAITAYYYSIKSLRKSRLEVTSAKEKHFRSLVNFNLQPLILYDSRGQIMFAGESIKELLGLKNPLPPDGSLDELLHPEDVSRYRKFLAGVLARPLEKGTIEVRMRKGADRWIWVRIDAVNLVGQGDIKAVVTSLQDITFQKDLDREKTDILHQEKTARNMAEKAVRDRDEFLSIASHELKTPLTTVLLQLQATLRKISTQSLADFSGNELLSSLQIAEKQSQSLAILIKDLLNISLATSGRLTLNKEPISLSQLVQSMPKKYEEEIRLSASPVETSIAEEEVVGHWDPIRIDQALSNLFSNALKYAQGKPITLVTSKADGWAVFQVIDQGEGIPASLQDKIFEPFQRASSNSKATGLGVGLFIARQIAQAHGGDITVNSKPGVGSTFTLRLPL